MKCKNGKMEAVGDSNAKVNPQVWKLFKEEVVVVVVCSIF
jgi:hypothetical protein